MLIDLPNANIDDAIEALKQLKEKLSINNQLLAKTKIYLTFKIANKRIDFINSQNGQANHLVLRDGLLCCNHAELCPEPKTPWYIVVRESETKIVLDIPEVKLNKREIKKITRKREDQERYFQMQAYQTEQMRKGILKYQQKEIEKAVKKAEHEKRMQTDPAYAKEIFEKKAAYSERCRQLARSRHAAKRLNSKEINKD